MRIEFETDGTSKERRMQLLTELQAIAIEDPANQPARRCGACQQALIHVPYSEALVKGHIYSREGLEEVRITGLCEHCFDEFTLVDEEKTSVMPLAGDLGINVPKSAAEQILEDGGL